MYSVITPLLVTLLMQSNPVDPNLLTVAEKSDYTATSTSAEVMELIDRIHRRSTIMQVAELGKTVEGKSIPLIVLATPPIKLDDLKGPANTVAHASGTSPSIARDSRPICFIMANIHAGEV